MRATVMTHTHAKVKGQRSLGSKVRVETDGPTDGGDCITCRANAAGNNENRRNKKDADILQMAW